MGNRTIDLGVAKIKFEEIPEKKIVIVSKCPFCDKRVRGSTHHHVEWNLALHIKQKHKDNNEAQILLKQLEEHNKTKK
jgi:hypothetical protein